MSLIYSKIRLPRWRPSLLQRPHLVDHLKANLARKLITVVAPAGYGKTTLLLDFAYHADVHPCWYSLDAGDRDLRVFIEYLVASLRLQSADFGTRTLEALHDFHPSKDEIARIVGVLVNDLYETFVGEAVILLDHFEAVDDSPDVGRFLEAFLHYLPDHIRLVLASRVFPQRSTVTLPLIVSGEMIGVSGHLLKFTPDEVAALAEQVYRRPIDAATAVELVEASEGWIMGIQLSSHALWAGQLLPILPHHSNQSLLHEYIRDQVLTPLPGPNQDFLLRSSLLEPLTPALVNAALGIDDAGQRLRQLAEHLPMFVQPLDAEETYRYHALFSQSLRQALAHDEARARAAHRGVGAALAAQGRLAEAVRHYLAAGDLVRVKELAGQAVDTLYRTGRWQTLQTLMADLPPAAYTPELLIAEAMRRREQGEIEPALKLLSDAEGGGDAYWSAIARLRRASIWSLQGRHAEALTLYQAVLASAEEPTDTLLGEAQRGLGRCYLNLRQTELAIDHLNRALGHFEAAQSQHNIAHVYHELGIAYTAQGYLDRALGAYRTALTHWDHLGAKVWRLNTLRSLAHILYEQEQHAEALNILDQCLVEAQELGYLTTEAWTRLYIGAILTQMGRQSQGWQTLNEALALAQQLEFPALIIYALDAIGNNLRLQGKLEQAQVTLQAALTLAEKHALPHETALCQLSLAVVALDRGAEDIAQTFLAACHAVFNASQATRELLVTEFHLGRLAYQRRDWTQATQRLDRAASLASETGNTQLLLQASGRAWSLIRWAISHTADRHFWERLFHRLRQETAPLSQDTVAPLEVVTFGKSAIRVQGEEAVPEWTTLRELFFYLLAHQPKGAHRDQLLGAFWPDTPSARAGQALKVALHRLRRSICETHHEAGWYSLVLPDGYVYDAGAFERLTEGLDPSGAMTVEQAANFEQAVSLYQGDYLLEYYSDWAQAERERLKHLYLQLLHSLGACYERRADYPRAVELYHKALAADEYQETIHQSLLRCYIALGDRHRAIQHFREMSMILKRDLGIEPAPETQRLYQQIVKDAS
ncbi:MAG: tetratricopeptide repeat protein [Anaerolineae bacterium]|nr:tetratricopeptide repeat protein [Anaerolineae bacterium]